MKQPEYPRRARIEAGTSYEEQLAGIVSKQCSQQGCVVPT
jgi:hypothetical protein